MTFLATGVLGAINDSKVFIPGYVSVSTLPKDEIPPSADVLNKFFEPSTPFFAFLLTTLNINNLRTDAMFFCIIRGEKKFCQWKLNFELAANF